MSTGPDLSLSQSVEELNFILHSFVRAIPGVHHVLGVSSDGLLMTVVSGMPRSTADKLAATVSGLTTLAASASRLLRRGALAQLILEADEGYIVTSMMSGRSCLGVVAAKDCDLGLVGYETTLLVQRLGPILTPELIRHLKTRLPL